MIINISSKINSGKDLVGQIIQYLTSSYLRGYYEGDRKVTFENFINQNVPTNSTPYEIHKFADALKDTICIWLGCTREVLETREFKEKELGQEWWKYKVQSQKVKNDMFFLVNYLDNPDLEAFGRPYELIKMTPRLLMQLLGTECGRDIIHPNIWVNTTLSKYKSSDNWVITDNRFPNESDAVACKCGINIRIERPFNQRFPEYQCLEEVYDKDIELYKVLTHYGENALDNYKGFDYIIQNDGTLQELIEKVLQILIKEKI